MSPLDLTNLPSRGRSDLDGRLIQIWLHSLQYILCIWCWWMYRGVDQGEIYDHCQWKRRPELRDPSFWSLGTDRGGRQNITLPLSAVLLLHCRLLIYASCKTFSEYISVFFVSTRDAHQPLKLWEKEILKMGQGSWNFQLIM